MHKYLIRREIPDAGKMSPQELRSASQKSCEVLERLGPHVQWVQSYVTDDTIHCVYVAPGEDDVREHAGEAGFPADEVMEVHAIIDPTTAIESDGAARPEVMDSEEGDVLWFFQESPDELGSGGELRIFMDPTTHPKAGGSFAKFTLGVGGALPVHRHDKTEEIGFILSGRGVMVRLDGDGSEVEVPLTPGSVWYNPPGAWHGVRNTGEVPLILVFATIPNEVNGLLSFFRRIGVEPGDEARVIPPEEFGRLGTEHDMILRPQRNRTPDRHKSAAGGGLHKTA